jgi:methylmalonyl-CoA/ethylmalonyl-CoA epimerase
VSAAIAPALGPIHHVGYVVADLDAALAGLAATFAVAVAVREVMHEQGVEALMCEGAGGAIELIRPLDPAGAIGRFMEKRGEGFHHVAFCVPDIEAALAALGARGAELIDDHGRRGLGGHTVAFLHPRSTLGVLTELIEQGNGAGEGR